jgi:diguanylate cyclase (GGDEF)-like protein
MARLARILFVAAFVVTVGIAAWLQFTTQRTRADQASARVAAAVAVFDHVVQAENAARDFTVTHNSTPLETYTRARAQLDDAITRARAKVGSGAGHTALGHELVLVDAWAAAATQDVEAAQGGGTADAARAAARGQQVADIRAAQNALVRELDRDDTDARDTAGVRGLALIVGCCVFFAALNWIFFVRQERREDRARDRQLEFAERLQAVRSEDAARATLARHLEEVAPGTMVLVTGPDERSSAGRPVTAGGDRVATVIIRSEHDLRPAVERLVRDSILRAGPVLATMRVLAAAQARAATDPLTGLGNRRLVEDALGRLVARARRTGERFALAVVDLDRFKPVNDTYGHAAGDALLVAVARVLDDATREYDVVGRHGGDEFMVLLAGLDATEAVAAMERCRLAIADLRVGQPPIGVTASIGVAPSGPLLLSDAEAIVRAADQAAYVAKAQGGNRVVAGTVVEGDPAPASAAPV